MENKLGIFCLVPEVWFRPNGCSDKVDFWCYKI